MPGDNRLWFDNDQDVTPCRPKAAEQDPKHSILDSQPRARLFSLEHAQLLTQGEDIENKTVGFRYASIPSSRVQYQFASYSRRIATLSVDPA